MCRLANKTFYLADVCEMWVRYLGHTNGSGPTQLQQSPEVCHRVYLFKLREQIKNAHKALLQSCCLSVQLKAKEVNDGREN